ncbi:hypothetical protein [Methylomagnum sp.]
MPRPAQIDYDTSDEVRELLIRRFEDLRGTPLRHRLSFHLKRLTWVAPSRGEEAPGEILDKIPGGRADCYREGVATLFSRRAWAGGDRSC